jgi:hypothetical protein
MEASPFDAGTAYIAGTMYKFDDDRPYLYKTVDYGKTWQQINNGIPSGAFTRCIREDPNKRDLLYAGTETGIYVSFNGGAKWQSLQLNLPVTQVADLAIQKREHELVAATHGRAFWILDDTNVLAQLTETLTNEDLHLFAPKHTYRGAFGRGFGRAADVGSNPPNGAVIYYWLKSKPAGEVTLEFLDESGKLVKKFSSKAVKEEHDGAAAEEEDDDEPRGGRNTLAPAEQGLNRFEWDLRYPDATRFPGMVLWAGSTRGPAVVPGTYQVRVTVDGKTQTQKFEVRKDPRISTTPEQLSAQLELSLQMRDKLSRTNETVIQIRQARKQIDELTARLEAGPQTDKSKALVEKAKGLSTEMTQVEEALYQTKSRASEDPLNYPVRLNNKLAAVLADLESSDSQPTSAEQQVYEDLATEINSQLKAWGQIVDEKIPTLNKSVKDADVPAVTLKKPAEPSLD